MTTNLGHISLDSKRILITGATGYLGRIMSLGLAELGAEVILNGRNEDEVSALVKDFRRMGYKASGALFDVNDPIAVTGWFEQNLRFPLHGLVNNAYSGSSGCIESSSDDDYRAAFEVSLVSAQRLLKQAIPKLREAAALTGNASVVNIASMYGVVCPDQRIYRDKDHANPPFYGAVKAGLIHWTRYAACEYGPYGVRVNSISPGPFPSPTVQRTSPEFISELEKKVPMGRIGQAHELKGPLSFLMSGSSTYVTGTNLIVDGGWTCW